MDLGEATIRVECRGGHTLGMYWSVSELVSVSGFLLVSRRHPADWQHIQNLGFALHYQTEPQAGLLFSPREVPDNSPISYCCLELNGCWKALTIYS